MLRIVFLYTTHAKYFTYSCLGLLVHCLGLGLGLGLKRHCLGLALGLEPQCLGFGLGLDTYCLAPITDYNCTQDSKIALEMLCNGTMPEFIREKVSETR